MSKPNFTAMTDHDLFRHIQKRVRLGWNWEPIADELGLSANELVEWVNEYKWPTKPKPTVSAPKEALLRIHPRDRTPQKKTEQFLAWRRARDGARKAREAGLA